jgi:hypothetical protein
MLRSFVLPLSFICLGLLAAVIISCGSSSGSKGCSGGPYIVVGDWTLSSGGASGPGIINSAGLAVFFQTSAATGNAPGDTVVMPTITGACSFSGNAMSYNTPSSGGFTASIPVTGSVTSATSISGTISNGTPFTLTPNSPLSGSPTALTGSLDGTIEGWTGAGNLWQMTFAATGSGAGMSFSGSSADGCNISGTLSQEGGNLSTLNVFDVSITYTGTNCPATGTVTGLGFESSSDYFSVTGGATGTYLYAASSNSASVFEIWPAGL